MPAGTGSHWPELKQEGSFTHWIQVPLVGDWISKAPSIISAGMTGFQAQTAWKKWFLALCVFPSCLVFKDPLEIFKSLVSSSSASRGEVTWGGCSASWGVQRMQPLQGECWSISTPGLCLVKECSGGAPLLQEIPEKLMEQVPPGTGWGLLCCNCTQ